MWHLGPVVTHRWACAAPFVYCANILSVCMQLMLKYSSQGIVNSLMQLADLSLDKQFFEALVRAWKQQVTWL